MVLLFHQYPFDFFKELLASFIFGPNKAALCNPGTTPAILFAVPAGSSLTIPAVAPIIPTPTIVPILVFIICPTNDFDFVFFTIYLFSPPFNVNIISFP